MGIIKMTKRLFLILSLITAILIPATIFAAEGTTATNAGTNFKEAGTAVIITAEASATTGAFTPILFSSDTNAQIYNDILSKWLTSARTTISATTAPTASYDIYILDSVIATSDFVLTSPTLAVGSNADDVASAAFSFVINGVSYSKAAVTTGTGPGNDVIPQNTYGAVAFDIGANGTIDAIEAADNATGYASAVLAIAGVAAAASDHCRMGYVTAMKSDGAFTFGTTELSAENVTEAYLSTIPAYDIAGGRLTNRSSTVSEEVYPANTAADNFYIFIRRPIMIIPVNNLVNSAVINLELIFN